MTTLTAARGAALAAGALLLAACGGDAAATLNAEALGLPASATAPLATTTIATSPDGGIYRNPDHVDVLAVGRGAPDAVARSVGAAAARWRVLDPLGPFTFIAVAIRDDGKVGSDPQLNDLQIASDLAPAGSDRGALRAFYHPMYPLAAASDGTLNDDCSVHLDPGTTTTVVLVYPPVQPVGGRVVWGRYDGFALSLPASGGGVGHSSQRLRALACRPPEAPPP